MKPVNFAALDAACSFGDHQHENRSLWIYLTGRDGIPVKNWKYKLRRTYWSVYYAIGWHHVMRYTADE